MRDLDEENSRDRLAEFSQWNSGKIDVVCNIFGGGDEFEERGIFAVPASRKLVAPHNDYQMVMPMAAMDGPISSRRRRAVANMEVSPRFVYHGYPRSSFFRGVLTHTPA